MGKTAAELMAELAKNKKFQTEKAAREEQLKKREQAYRADEKGLVQELHEAGFVKLVSVWDFVNTEGDYKKAVPVLIKHLKAEHHPKILAGIARSLALPQLSGDDDLWQTLIEIYARTLPDTQIENPEDRGVQQAVAVALEALATKERVSSLEELVNTNKDGDSLEWLKGRIKEFKRS